MNENPTNAAEQADLGLAYYDGNGVPKDLEKAAYWFTKAAEQGNAPAQCNLGFCYSKGEGVPQDKNKAIYWYTKAAEQGHAGAQQNLETLKNDGGPPGCLSMVLLYGAIGFVLIILFQMCVNC